MGHILIVLTAFAVCVFILLGWHFERPTGSPRRRRRPARSYATPTASSRRSFD